MIFRDPRAWPQRRCDAAPQHSYVKIFAEQAVVQWALKQTADLSMGTSRKCHSRSAACGCISRWRSRNVAAIVARTSWKVLWPTKLCAARLARLGTTTIRRRKLIVTGKKAPPCLLRLKDSIM